MFVLPYKGKSGNEAEDDLVGHEVKEKDEMVQFLSKFCYDPSRWLGNGFACACLSNDLVPETM